MIEDELLLDYWLANERTLVAVDSLFCMEVAVGDVTLPEDKMFGNDCVLLAVVEILLGVGDWPIEEDAPTGSEDREMVLGDVLRESLFIVLEAFCVVFDLDVTLTLSDIKADVIQLSVLEIIGGLISIFVVYELEEPVDLAEEDPELVVDKEFMGSELDVMEIAEVFGRVSETECNIGELGV